jgi:hypothetical protein
MLAKAALTAAIRRPATLAKVCMWERLASIELID